MKTLEKFGHLVLHFLWSLLVFSSASQHLIGGGPGSPGSP